MKIGEVAKRTGVSRDTIRLYERMGLVKNVTRPHQFNNYKEYEANNVDRIKLVLVMKRFGMTLKECKYILDKIEGDDYDMDFQKTFINQKIKEIEDQIKELTQLKGLFKKHLNGFCDKNDIEELKNNL